LSNKPDILKGVFAAVLTPLNADLSPNVKAQAGHAKWLLENGCNGLAVLGTTGEANSFSIKERISILEGLVAAGVPAKAMMPGTGCCAISDTVELSKKAVELGASGVLMLPPFYYKGVSDDGLYAAYAETIERIGDDRLRVYLYHIPPMSQMPISVALIERLVKAYPDTVVGLKDSSGVVENMTGIAKKFPGFAVFSGGDHLTLDLMKAGGAGCITAVCNIAPHWLQELYQGWQGKTAQDLQDRMAKLRDLIITCPQVPALRAVVARHTGDDGWRKPRPPLLTLDEARYRELYKKLDDVGFSMPGQIRAAAQ
jgi:4-hydroxy-tetrahydrodipicolinate synthase